MKPGPSGTTLPWSTFRLRQIVNPSTRAAYIYMQAYAHELALRIRAQFGYEWLMLYKRERRKAVKCVGGRAE